MTGTVTTTSAVGAGPLTRLGRLAHRRARLLLAVTALLLVAATALGVGAFGQLRSGGFDDPASPSSRAAKLLDTHFGGQSDLVLLAHPRTGTVDSAPARAAGRALTAELRSDPALSDVVSYWGTGAAALHTSDGSQALLLAHVRGTEQQAATATKRLIPAYTGRHGVLTVQAGGPRAINHDVTAQVSKDLVLAESIAVPVTLALLVLAFGSVLAALLPLAIGGVAILGTFAELAVLGRITDVSVFAINLTTALGLGLGIDYALLLVSRFREQLAAGQDIPQALITTVRTAGRTIIFSAATVATALAALLLFPPFFLRSFAYAGIGVVAIAALAALVVVPALLALLGHRVNAWRLPWPRQARGADAPFWGSLAARVMRRPVLWALPTLAVLLVAAAPLLGAHFGTPDERVLPSTAPSRQVAQVLDTCFPGNDTSALQIVTDRPVAPAPLTDYARRLSRLPGVVQVETSLGVFRSGTGPAASGPDAPALGNPLGQHLVAATADPPRSSVARQLVRDVRALPGPGTASALVGGGDAALVDAQHTIGSRLPYALALIVCTTAVLLFLFTGSVIQPLRALLLNALTLSAALGAMVWVFQDGHLSSLLGFTPRPMDMSMTVLMFCVAFGLSMDYEVFVISRIKELRDRGASPGEAVVRGLSRTGRIVSTAAGLLAVTFFAFGTGRISFLQMFGLGSGLAIVLDALLVRGILVPAALRVLGRAAWYAPAPLRRAHARLGLNEAPDHPTTPEEPAPRQPSPAAGT
jgi:RND superfamily putative drug exporter